MLRANRHFLPDCIWHLTHRCYEREAAWSESLAVGSEGFVREMKQKLGTSAGFREVEDDADVFVLREAPMRYETDSAAEGAAVQQSNLVPLNREFEDDDPA